MHAGNSGAFSERCQISKMDLIAVLVNGCRQKVPTWMF